MKFQMDKKLTAEIVLVALRNIHTSSVSRKLFLSLQVQRWCAPTHQPPIPVRFLHQRVSRVSDAAPGNMLWHHSCWCPSHILKEYFSDTSGMKNREQCETIFRLYQDYPPVWGLHIYLRRILQNKLVKKLYVRFNKTDTPSAPIRLCSFFKHK